MSQVPPPATTARVVPAFHQAVVTLRADGTVGGWNAGATELYGWTEEEALGQPGADLLPTTWPQREETIATAIAEAGGWVGTIVRRNRDGDALLLLAIRSAADGGVVETTLRLPDEVAAISLVPEEDERGDRVFVLEPLTDEAGEIVDMRIAYANENAALSFVKPPSEIVGRPMSEVFPAYLASSMFVTHCRVATSGEPVEVSDWRMEVPPGSGYEHSFEGIVVPFGSGVASRSRDVTAERRALQALDDAQARVRVALAVAPVSVGQLNERLEYEWLLDNITDTDPAEFIGRELGCRSAPEDAERVRAAARHVMETGAEERLEIRGGEGLERFTALQLTITPRLDVSGRVRGVRVAMIDVSRHERLEAELRSSRDMMRAVLDQTPGAVYVVDPDGRILFINARSAALFGTTVEGALGRTQAELIEPEAAAWMAEQDARVLRTGEDHEVRLVVGDELLLVRRFPVRDADGQIQAIGSLAIDLDPDVTAPPAP